MIASVRRRVWWQQVLIIGIVCTLFVQIAGFLGAHVLVPIYWLGWTG